MMSIKTIKVLLHKALIQITYYEISKNSEGLERAIELLKDSIKELQEKLNALNK